MAQLDPITLSTAWHFLQRVAREMRDASFRTAVNPLIALLHDISTGIFDAQGRAVAVPEGFANRMFTLSLVL